MSSYKKNGGRGALFLTLAIVAVAFTIGLLLVLFTPLFQRAAEKHSPISISLFEATPADAAILLYLPNIGNTPFTDELFPYDTLLYRMVDPEGLAGVLSYHYGAGAGDYSLLSIEVDSTQRARLTDSWGSHLIRQYEGVKLYRIDKISFTVLGSRVLLSTSPILLESSIRAVKERCSIASTPHFASFLSTVGGGENLLFIEHRKGEKFFSKFIDIKGREELLPLFRKVAHRSFTTIHLSGENIRAQSQLLLDPLSNERLLPFENLEGGRITAPSTLPATTQYFFSISSNREIERGVLQESHLDGVAGSKKGREWLEGLKLKELAVASFPIDKQLSYFILLKGEKSGRGLKKRDGEISIFQYPSLLGEIYGNRFTLESEEAIVKRGEWYWIGKFKDLDSLEELLDSTQTLQDHFKERESKFEKRRRGREEYLSLYLAGHYLSTYIDSHFTSNVGKVLLPPLSPTLNPHLYIELFREGGSSIEAEINFYRERLSIEEKKGE
ncbi:MAG: hypothetical protein WC960_01350 [Bacteroidales bacterium]